MGSVVDLGSSDCDSLFREGGEMKLITSVRIRGLRSIEDQALATVGNFTAFVGKNSSGKSNVLRALNLFFNQSIEPNKSLNFARDHFEQVPRSKQKKRIRISVGFQLPSTFHLRKEMARIARIGAKFTVTREWELDRLRNPIGRLFLQKDDDSVVPDSEDLARQFLSLIFFRYIPNRSIPSQILRAESQELANSIFMRMKGDTHGAALLNQLQAAAGRMLEAAARSLLISGAPLSEARVATPASIGEMLSMTGFQAKGSHGADVQDEDWGTGHQAFFLYQVLYALDTNYARFFGWRQATIWGVEEPESALHRDLETRLASLLREWSTDKDSRLQIVQSTHSPIFTMAADAGYWADIENGATKFIPMSIQQLTKAAEERGVSGWMHPALAFPWNPVVLVEGPIDAAVLTHVADIAGLSHLRFLSLPSLDKDESGGKDALITYVRRHAALIANRQKHAPLVVLFDWELPEVELKKARTAYGPFADRFVARMEARHCDPYLSDEFAGVERFYPPQIIQDAHSAGEIVVGMSAGKPFSVSAGQLKKAKGPLLTRVLRVSDKTALRPLISVVQELDAAIRAAATSQPLLTGLPTSSA
jgi:predicted ATPase